ncbi:MAG: CPBP family intramembrane metalloprotease [Planctomycetes bacterium]|nr:CPBP family intramembrane metalloprotease [Planctomycetota bacterium]
MCDKDTILKEGAGRTGACLRPLPVRICGVCIPYAAVGIGLYVFGSAWIAAGLYYGGAIIYIAATGRKELMAGSAAWAGSAPILRTRDRGLAIVAYGVFALAGVALFYLWPVAVRSDVDLAGFLEAMGLGGRRFLVFAVVFCLLNPVVEEVFWRGCLKDDRRRVSWIDAAFAGYHVPVLVMVINVGVSAVAFAILCTTSWYLRRLRHKSGGLGLGWAAHFLADVSIMTAAWVLLN